MAIQPYSEENVRGSYGESRYGDRVTYLKNLRKELDAGNITVDQFVKLGKPVAEEATQIYNQLANSGSKAATAVVSIGGGRLESVLPNIGFKTSSGADGEIKTQIKLPETYQEQIRNSLIPANVTGEERERLLKDIPLDIELGSDQYNLEREGIRQRMQQEQVAGEQTTKRRSLLTDLSGLLQNQATISRERAIPEIAEQANVAGIYRSTGFGQALADNELQLQQDIASTLGNKALEYGETDVNVLGDILSNQQGFQSAGVERKFSLDDFARQAAYARELAMLSKPAEPKGKSKGERWAQGINLGIKAGQTVSGGKSGGQK